MRRGQLPLFLLLVPIGLWTWYHAGVFGHAPTPITPLPLIALLPAACAVRLHLRSAIFAYQGEAFAGVAGLVTAESRFLRLSLSRALRHLGPGRGLVYHLVARADGRVAGGEVKVQALAVRRGMRGQGIGRGLLSHVEALAQDWGCRALSLDVVDTNTVARRLYAWAGFEVVARTRYGLLTRGAGFGATYHLWKRIAADRAQ